MTQLIRITPLNRSVENLDRMHTPLTEEQQAASEAHHQQLIALHEQFKSEWVPPEGYSRDWDLEEMANIESAAFTVWQERRKGRIVAASTPVWVLAFEYWLIDGPGMDDSGILAKQPTAVSLTLPIMLKGGGDMQVTFETRKYVFGSEPQTSSEFKHKLIVRTEHGVFSGRLEREFGERSWYVVSLPSNAPQAVADRIATTLDAINQLNLTESYLAIMPVTDCCAICARPLTDLVSKTLGIGSDCAASLGVKHSAAIADAIIVKRRAFLADEIVAVDAARRDA